MSWLLFPSSGNHVTLEPEWDFARKDAQVKDEHVTRAGKRYVYKWGSFVRFMFGLEFVSSADAAVINSWYMTNTKLLFVESGGADVYSVMLVGKEVPMSGYVKPYDDLYRGTIDLQGY